MKETESEGRILTENKSDKIGVRLEHSPRKSLRRFAQESGFKLSGLLCSRKGISAREYELLLKYN
jgi:hypothetical protein